MFKIILIFSFAIAFFLSPVFRCLVFNFWRSIPNFFIDVFKYFKYRAWRVAPCGELVSYTGLFGKGKTLSAVHCVVSLYKRYNDLMVYDKLRKKFVKQNVVILSNVSLNGVPFKHFESLHQMVELSHQLKELDEQNNTLTYLYVLADELSVQMNSRNFKSNIDPLFLNTLLTCRHYHISMYYTAQRFNQVDALLRQVTQRVFDCDKNWRIQLQRVYDGYELENCTNPLLVKPLKIVTWFIRNKDFGYYDTLACVDNLTKDAMSGDMLSPEEILQLQTGQPSDTVVNYSRKARKRRPFKH